METNPRECPHKPADASFTPLFGGAKVVLSERLKAVAPFGGLRSFVALLEQIEFCARVTKEMPFPAPTSPNAIPLAHTFTAFVFAVESGVIEVGWNAGDREIIGKDQCEVHAVPVWGRTARRDLRDTG